MNSEIVEYLKEIVESRTCKEIAILINKKYNTNYTEHEIYNAKRRYKLKSNVNCTFKKGDIPHNKGKKWDEYMPYQSQINSKTTCFKKGHKPHNWLPVGSEWINDKGYTYIKKGEPNDWQLKHRYIYEQHYGKIPKNHCVIFLNCDKNDFNINNLKLVKVREKLVMKNNHLFTYNKKATITGLKVAQLINKTHDIKSNI